MIETVVALLYVCKRRNQRTRLQTDGMAQCLRGKRDAESEYSENVVSMLER